MTQVSVSLRCVLIRSGIELWIEEARAQTLIRNLERSRFIEIDGQVINTADISGIYTADKMEEYKRHKQGQWQCKKRMWHDRGEKCDCSRKRYDEHGRLVAEFVSGSGWREV